MLPRIDTDVEQLTLKALMAHTGQVWHRLGETEPHFSVLSNPMFTSDRIGETRDAFYASGEDDVLRLKGTAERCGVQLPLQGTCLELGCGVGRMTLWLAKSFRRVIGVDISASHLAIAEQNVRLEGCRNVELRHVNRLEAVANFPTFDFFCSVIVLQHNPPPVIRWLLVAILSKLNPGGVAIFQVPTVLPNYQFDADAYLADPPSLGVMEMHAIPHEAVLSAIEEAGCKLVEAREYDCIGVDGGMSIEFVVRRRLPILHSIASSLSRFTPLLRRGYGSPRG